MKECKDVEDVIELMAIEQLLSGDNDYWTSHIENREKTQECHRSRPTAWLMTMSKQEDKL